MDSLIFSARWHKRKTLLLLCVTLALAAAAELLPMLSASAALLPEESALELPPPGYVEPEEPEPPAPNYLGKTGVYLETEEDIVPYDTVYEDDYTLPKGETAVKQAGQPYHRTLSYEITYYHDREQERRFVGEEVISDTVTEVIAVGTLVKEARAGDKIKKVVTLDDGSGYLLMSSGDSLRFTAVRTLSATAYTAGVGGVGTITATGTTVHVGCVAIDRKVIPLGTKMYVTAGKNWNYGMAKAEDVGVKGERIDLYMDTYEECRLFGRRNATVYILAK